MGALPTVRAATDPDAAGGEYFGTGLLMELTGPPRVVRSTARSHDTDTQRRLWSVSEQLTGVEFLSSRGGSSPPRPRHLQSPHERVTAADRDHGRHLRPDPSWPPRGRQRGRHFFSLDEVIFVPTVMPYPITCARSRRPRTAT